jgi:Fe-S-cluster containining protein
MTGPPEVAPIRHFFRKQARPVDAPPGGGAFADAFDDAAPPDAAPLVEAMAYVREHLPQAENIGRTGDAKDFYHHLDKLAEGVSKTFPRSFCKAGCSGCCYYPVGLFTISFTEWEVMRDHIETEWTDAQRDAFAARYRKTFTGFWRFVLGQLQNSFVSLIVTAPLVHRARIACPFLEGDRCSVYAVRPYQCRTFGLFAARSLGPEPKVYACNLQGENLLHQLKRTGPQIQLPVMNPIVRQIRKLCQGPKLALPIWAGIWVARYDKGRGGAAGR